MVGQLDLDSAKTTSRCSQASLPLPPRYTCVCVSRSQGRDTQHQTAQKPFFFPPALVESESNRERVKERERKREIESKVLLKFSAICIICLAILFYFICLKKECSLTCSYLVSMVAVQVIVLNSSSSKC